jgi:hypothetical protein
MGVAPVVVRHLLSQAITFTSFTGSSRSPNRMVTFSVALLLYGFVVSNLWTQLFVTLTSFPLLTFTLWCIWMCWDSDGGTVPARLEFLESLRFLTARAFPVRAATLASDDGSSMHSPSNSRCNVSGV